MLTLPNESFDVSKIGTVSIRFFASSVGIVWYPTPLQCQHRFEANLSVPSVASVGRRKPTHRGKVGTASEVSDRRPRHLVRVGRNSGDGVSVRVHEEVRHNRRGDHKERPRAKLDKLEVRRHSSAILSEIAGLALLRPGFRLRTERSVVWNGRSWTGGWGKGEKVGVTGLKRREAGKHSEFRKAGGGRGVLDIVHGRSCMTIDPRLPTNAGTGHVGFSPTRQTFACTKHQAP